MREYLFRGKRLTNGEWVYGSYVYQHGANTIYFPSGENGFDWCHINPESVGQYTGMRDKNAKRVFEGDILEVDLYPYACLSEHICLAQVAWREYESAFGLYIFKDMTPKNNGIEIGKCVDMDEDESANYEVIGNIHDNKDLLEV